MPVVSRRAAMEVAIGAALTGLCLFFWLPRKAGAVTPLAFTPAANWSLVSTPVNAPAKADAPVVIVVFDDFQCPFCKRLDEALVQLEREAPRVAVIFRHHPLTSIHPLAMPAAIASECARAQGRFNEYRATLFANQEHLGGRTWRDYAADVGVPDLQRFVACTQSDTLVRAAIARDVAASQAMPRQGTPAVAINGNDLSRPPTLEELRSLVTRYAGASGHSSSSR